MKGMQEVLIISDFFPVDYRNRNQVQVEASGFKLISPDN